MTVKNRVVERRRMKSADLAANPKNWRMHPPYQASVLRGILEEIGQAGELLAYRSERAGGALTLIDGHLRLAEADEWDVAITDLTDEEADKLLLVYDPVAGLAEKNAEILGSLCSTVRTNDWGLAALIQSLQESPAPPPSFTPNVEPSQSGTEYSAEDIQKRRQEMLDAMGRPAGLVSVTCPKCAEVFHIPENSKGYAT